MLEPIKTSDLHIIVPYVFGVKKFRRNYRAWCRRKNIPISDDWVRGRKWVKEKKSLDNKI